jgi:hypothetical protein
MKKRIQASIVYDQLGKIVSISRPAQGVNLVVLSGNGHSVLVTEVDEDSINSLIDSHRVDISRNSLVQCDR